MSVDQVTNPQLASFSEAFGPLAHHLFPDGCPKESLAEVWPRRIDRSTVSHLEAKQGFTSLKQRGHRYGYATSEMECLAVVACATLPSTGSGSRLVDGTSKCLRELLRCMIPKREERVSVFIVTSLVTVRCDDLGKAMIVRFLTLCLRNGFLSDYARQRLSSFYTILFSWLPCEDTFRLVHALTRRKHATSDRAKRLRMWYDESRTLVELHKRMAPLWLLLQLFARYDPTGCGKYFSSSKRHSGALSKYFQIPDQTWEQDFIDKWQTSQDTTLESFVRPEKRQKMKEGVSMEWLENAFDGVHSFSLGLAVANQERRILWASDLLMDDTIRNLLVLNKNDDGVEIVRLRACLPYMLHEEWWFQQPKHAVKTKHTSKRNDWSTSDVSSSASDSDLEPNDDGDISALASPTEQILIEREHPRLRILRGIASLASYSSSLLYEAEIFILDEVVPYWDGSDHFGQLLCHELLPFLAPRRFTDLNHVVLCYLAPLIHYGSPQTQHLIISGAMRAILKHWSHCNWSEVTTKKNKSSNSISIQQQTLQDLIQWTESQILKAMMINNGHELLCECAIDFFDVVVEHSPYLVLPGPSLVYRLLLSKSACGIDYLCSLLVKYKGVLQRLKLSSESFDEEIHNRIALFNCYVWDICSVLWRKSPLPSTDSLEMNMARCKSILFTDLSAETLGFLHDDYDSISVALSVTHGAAFRSYIRAFWGESEDNVLEGNVKLKYLDFLKAQGLVGIYNFLTSFVSSLASREERRKQRDNMKRTEESETNI